MEPLAIKRHDGRARAPGGESDVYVVDLPRNELGQQLRRQSDRPDAHPRRLCRLARGARREHEIRRSIKELASLDDRMLRDIGLTRWDVERAVRFGRI